MSPSRLSSLFLIAGLLVSAGCGDKEDDTGEVNEDDTNESSADDTSSSEGVTGTISGTVRVQLYDDSTGERVLVDWADAGYTEFPFGKVFIAAGSEDENGHYTYFGDATIDAPSLTGDAYEMQVEIENGDTVRVFGQVDYYVDRVLGDGDPVGFHDGLVTVPDGGEVSGVDITILVPVPRGGGGCGDGVPTIEISGDVIIPMSYAGGDVAIWLETNSGYGPYYATWFTPTPVTQGDGAGTPYAITACSGLGQMRLKGGWDRNGNDLIDVRDRYGAYISSPDTNANPITVGGTDLTAYDVQIPLDGVGGFDIVPFTSLSGTVSMEGGGAFDGAMAANSAVYVAALKYRPNSDLAVSTMEEYSYGVESWTWPELTGETSKAFSIPVPGNTIVYLWAYGDSGDSGIIGVVNEVGEFVAAGGDAGNGQIPTGEDGASGLSLQLAQP